MKSFAPALLLSSLASLAMAQDLAGVDEAGALAACPTFTRTALPADCRRRDCFRQDCRVVSTVQIPCGCPSRVPTATLVQPCDADCPYGGCDFGVFTRTEQCRPTSTSRPPPPRTSSSTTTPRVTTGVTILPPRTSTRRVTTSTRAVVTPCPTVTQTRRPDGCDPIRCPIPGCTVSRTLSLPCGCEAPRTELVIDGCQTECPGGCATRTSTVTASVC